MLNYDHEYDGGGRHRLIIGDNVGDWVPYAFIAFLDYEGKRYAATTEYYGDQLPRTFEVIPCNFNEIEAETIA